MATYLPSLLILWVILRLHEIVPVFAIFVPVTLTLLLSAIALVMKMSSDKSTHGTAPHIRYYGLLFVWTLLSTVPVIGIKPTLDIVWYSVGLCALLFQLYTVAASSVRGFTVVSRTMVAIGIFTSVCAVHMSMQPRQCIENVLNEDEPNAARYEVFTGRPCDSNYSCRKGEGVNPYGEYRCDEVGWFQATSVDGRTRWVGTLGDPNELSVVIGTVMPFLFAYQKMSKKKWVSPVVYAIVALFLWAIITTKSRGGQLVVAAIFAIAFVKRFGRSGVIAAGLATLPVMLLGGRDGAGAEGSTAERISILREGTEMVLHHPIFGVGSGQFPAQCSVHLTAHNSYLLLAAELGVPGSIFWLLLLLSSIKIAYVVSTKPPPGLDPDVITLAEALLGGLIGMSVGIFFLSFNYKHFAHTMFGLAGAVFIMVRRTHPQFDPKPTGSEIAKLSVGYTIFLLFLFVWSHRA